jgi:hypothetical protein
MKKLIFCFDGTCNSPDTFDDYLEDTSITNILKLHAMFGGSLMPLNGENDAFPDQHSFYYSGVGTRGGWLAKKINAMFAPPYGDLDEILDSALKDLDDNYEEGYEIFIFGFSRGAAIARMFASKVPHSVKFVGVFDTVAATRGSLDLSPNTFPASGIVFEDGTMGSHISESVHLLSLDEKRVLFQPTLFNSDTRITEVWFSGVHSDIGGGYWFDGLSDIALQFMIDKVKGYLSVISVDNIDYKRLTVRNSQERICKDDLSINALSNGKIHLQNVDGSIDKKLLSARVPRVNVDDFPSKNDFPIIHHSVIDRFNTVSEYRPYALRDVSYRVLNENGTLSEPRKGISELIE